MQQVTNKHFALFKSKVKQYMKFLGMGSWSVWFGQDPLEGRALAQVRWDITAQHATFILCNEWDNTKLDDDAIAETAYHEVLELLLANFDYVARNKRDYDPSLWDAEMDRATHVVIQTLSNAYWEITDAL